MAITEPASCKDITKLNCLVQVMLQHALKDFEEKTVNGMKMNALIVETKRTKVRQYYLYAKGRTATECIIKGVPIKYAKEFTALTKKQGYTGEVSWTLNSMHITGRAVDVIPYLDTNKDGIKECIWAHSNNLYVAELVKSMRRYGFEDGDSWSKNQDSPHYQVKTDIGKTISKKSTTTYLTKAIQNALNSLIYAGLLTVKTPLVVDGCWGNKTDEAVIAFRKYKKYRNQDPTIGQTALNTLFNLYDKYSK